MKNSHNPNKNRNKQRRKKFRIKHRRRIPLKQKGNKRHRQYR